MSGNNNTPQFDNTDLRALVRRREMERAYREMCKTTWRVLANLLDDMENKPSREDAPSDS